MVRPSSGLSHNDSPIHPRRHRHGNHKSTQQSLSHLPTNLRCRFSWASSSKHGLRHILLHKLCARNQIFFRSQTRPLHEDPATNPLLRPNGRHPSIKFHTNRGLELDVRIHPQPLHPAGNQRLHVSYRESSLQRQHSVGCRWSAAVLRTGSALQTTHLGLLGRSHCTNRRVVFR